MPNGALIFLPRADKPIHCVSQLIGLLSLLCFPLCHKENLDFSKMFISAWIFSSPFPVLDLKKKEKKIFLKREMIKLKSKDKRSCKSLKLYA